ncbi:PEP-CTERM sorting domain-containing protein [Alteromonas mediterranea]|uniref:PEP-CTERM sorting domain-containing protein n=1 Tax=Alteromonas mediterranea TaxID=314275 RepID=UPI0011300233|nr:PEP-CTERM sorting domain-containing protein [Alteromonas mediterranea]QDG39180.1 PEP-CTERM sorting domain-containing protein [Alteromonas mediterranea]
MKKYALIAGVVAALTSSQAFSDQFYIDTGVDFDAGDNADVAVNQNTTGWIDALVYEYTSSSTVGCSPVALAGGATCAINSTGGIDVSSLSSFFATYPSNTVTALTPQEVNGNIFTPDANSNNGYGNDNWQLAFNFELDGTVSDVGGTLVSDFTSGSITFYYFDQARIAAATLASSISDIVTELFTIDVDSTRNVLGQGQFLNGEITSVGGGDVNGVAAGDVFNFAEGSFGALLGKDVSISSFVDYNTDPIDTAGVDPFASSFNIGGEHEGSISFAVAEPSVIALMGLGLLGLAGASRRRKF